MGNGSVRLWTLLAQAEKLRHEFTSHAVVKEHQYLN
jgi:hypothetical protein